jgi:hypothetical protein
VFTTKVRELGIVRIEHDVSESAPRFPHLKFLLLLQVYPKEVESMHWMGHPEPKTLYSSLEQTQEQTLPFLHLQNLYRGILQQ